jgi:hypothetical protein
MYYSQRQPCSKVSREGHYILNTLSLVDQDPPTCVRNTSEAGVQGEFWFGPVLHLSGR